MNKQTKEPLLRTVKRAEMGNRQILILRLLAILLSLVAGGIFILCIGYNPFVIYGTIITGAFRSAMAVQATVKIMIPLLICSLGVTLAFKMRFWNIGAEGQLIFGATCASFFALYCSNWNHVVLLLVMAVAGIVGGGLWGLIPAFFKVKFNTNETLFTLMMNYVAIQLVSYFCMLWENPKGAGKIGIINRETEAGWLPVIGDKTYLLNILIVLAITIAMYIYLKYSKHGYEISVVGESENTARYIGINVKKVILRTMALSGAVCGIAGLLLVGGTDHTISTTTADGRGFTAIMVSWLAKFNPIYIIFLKLSFIYTFTVLL